MCFFAAALHLSAALSILGKQQLLIGSVDHSDRENAFAYIATHSQI